MFRRMGKPAAFQLISAGVEPSLSGNGQENLWRTYTLKTDGFECEIKEIFPDRRMFASPQVRVDSITFAMWLYAKVYA
jgi:hypothetical protein